MKIEINENYDVVLTEIYNGILLRTKEGNEIGICMRDDTFEINVITGGSGWHRVNIQNGRIEHMGSEIEFCPRTDFDKAPQQGNEDG